MIQTISYNNSTIRFNDSGTGMPIVLLHGYLESLDIWEEFENKLKSHARIISVDLPGHGKTGCFGEVHTMDFMAEVVNEVLVFLKIDKCVMIGHSMGGYVTMAFLEKYADKLSGFSLFHSSPFADTPEKAENRTREIKLVQALKKAQLYTEHVPKTFAPHNIDKFILQIGYAKIIAQRTPDAGIIAALEGMKQRPDRSNLLKNTNLPFLYILGKHDQFIPQQILDKIQFPVNHKILVLENSGHQGYIEECEKSADEILNYFCK